MARASVPVETSIEKISPAEANEILAKNELNRRLSKIRVQRIAQDIQEGRWVLNGENIKISRSGALLDGQHRLRAIVLADKPVEMFVTRGLPDQVFESIDQGFARSTGDVLDIEGASHAKSLAAAGQLCLAIESTGTPIMRPRPSRSQVLEYIKKNTGLTNSFEATQKVTQAKLLRPAVAMGLHYLMSKNGHAEEANQFFEMLGTGLNIPSERHPVAVLRNRLNNRYSSPINYLEAAAFVIKAWNAFIAGGEYPVAVLRWSYNEPFPVID